MFKIVALAGTFDHLHKGHEYFIIEAFKQGKRVIIGLMSGEFVEKKSKVKSQKSKSQIKIQNYSQREEVLKDFLIRSKLIDRAEIIKIDDVYGPAGEDTKIEALVVTRETQKGADEVNQKRKSLKLPQLRVVIVPYMNADDDKRISSTRIRKGEIDRYGHIFENVSIQLEPISLRLRDMLKKPLGRLIQKDLVSHTFKGTTFKGYPMVTIGDEVTKYCNQMIRIPDIAIIDFVVERVPKYTSLSELGFKTSNVYKTVENQAGHVSKALVRAISEAFHKNLSDGLSRIIRVIGEEDLAGVPAILLAPLGTKVLYGQPGVGLVMVEVTEEKKHELVQLIERNK